MPRIAVIVPVYSIEQYLPRCVDSILAQTFEDFELILVDDGSPDRCGAMCDAYAEKDDRITVIHQQNEGQAGARNHGVREAIAPYVTFVDGDDMIHPQMLEILWRGVEESGAQISMCRELEAKSLPEDFCQRVTAHFAKCAICDEMLARLIESDSYVYWAPWPKLIAREILLKFPFTVGRIYEDSAVVFRWLCEAGTVADCDAKLYFYQVNESGTTKKAFSVKRLDKLWSAEQQIAFYEQKGYSNMLDIVFHSYMFGACDLCRQVVDELGRKDLSRDIRKRALKVYNRCCRTVAVSPYERDRWMEVLRPIRSKILWKLQSAFAKKL